MSSITIEDVEVGARAPWSGIVPAGGELAIIDLGGNQAVDCLLYNPHDTAERYCAHTTIAAPHPSKIGSRSCSGVSRVKMSVSLRGVAWQNNTSPTSSIHSRHVAGHFASRL